jgi:hypothetical protein
MLKRSPKVVKVAEGTTKAAGFEIALNELMVGLEK